MDNLSLDRTETDRDRPILDRVEPVSWRNVTSVNRKSI